MDWTGLDWTGHGLDPRNAHNTLSIGLTLWDLCRSCVQRDDYCQWWRTEWEWRRTRCSTSNDATQQVRSVTAQSLQRLGYGLDSPRFKFRQQQAIFLYSKAPHKFWSSSSLL